MSICSGLIIIGRYVPEKYKKRICLNSNVRNMILKITYEQLFQSFKGIEGDIWLESSTVVPPTEDGILAKMENINEIIRFYDLNKKNKKCDLVCLCDISGCDVSPLLKNKFVFFGYDVGLYNSIYSYWSCVFHEVINGLVSELQSFAENLNKYFLFSNIEDAQKFILRRNKLCQEGCSGLELEDIEYMSEGQPCCVFGVYGYKEQ